MITPDELEKLRKELNSYRATSSLWFYSGIVMKKLLDYVDYLEEQLKEKENVKPD